MRFNFLKLFLSLCFVLSLSLGSTQTTTQTTNQTNGQTTGQTYVQLILDASGSMWLKLEDDTYKITAAKQVLSNFIKGLPTGDLNVGLRVYGSRISAADEGACEDTELFVPMLGVDKPALQDTVDEVTATGATPIALSLQKAAQDFPTDASEKVIIIVTDGEESCGGDLKAVVEDLKAQGIDFDLKIVGFSLSDRAQGSFDGLGEFVEFVNAEDAAQLANALESAVEEVIEDVEVEQVEEVERGEINLIANSSTSAGKAFEIGYEGDIQEEDYITIVTPETPDGHYLEYKYVDVEALVAISLTAPFEIGTYELRYMDGILGREDVVLARQELVVEESGITLEYPKEVILGSEFDVTWSGPAGEKDYITVVELGAPDGAYTSYVYLNKGNPITLTAPSIPGTYEVRYTTDRQAEKGQNFYSQPITVLPTTYSLTTVSEVSAGTNFEVAWAGPNGANDYITIVPLGAPEGDYMSYVYLTKGNPVMLLAPSEAGNYEIRYTTDRSDAKGKNFYSIPITVVAASFDLSAPSEVDVGKSFEVTWQGPNGPQDYITIVPVGAAAGKYLSYAYLTKGNPITLVAPDEIGNYEIRYTTNRAAEKGKILYSLPITVK